MPGPESERNAIDVVIQYAVEILGFPVSNIVIYAWSIGECSDHSRQFCSVKIVYTPMVRIAHLYDFNIIVFFFILLFFVSKQVIFEFYIELGKFFFKAKIELA